MNYPSYPNGAGHRGVDTSIAGVEHIAGDLPYLQKQVRDVIANAEAEGATGDEIATELEWNRFRVRPRTSELRAAGRIVDSGFRRKNQTGVSAIVWVLPQYKQGDAA